jgi:hypothetical protein
MVNTTVSIRLYAGPARPAVNAWTVWEPAYRQDLKPGSLEKGPGIVQQPADGTPALVSLPPDMMWFVTVVMEGAATTTRAVRVPASTAVLDFGGLPEVTDPAQLGPGPTYLQRTLEAMVRVNATAAGITTAIAEARALAATLRRGEPNGVAALNRDGDVVNAAGAVLMTEREATDQITRAIAKAVASIPSNPGTGPGTGAPGTRPDWGTPGLALQRLDDGAAARWVMGIVWDSTGDERDEAPVAGTEKLFAEIWKNRALALRPWVKTTDGYAPTVVLQNGSGRAGSVPIGATGSEGGAATTKKTVIEFSDSFNRDGELVGSSAETAAGPWKGQTGHYRTNGTAGVLEPVILANGQTAGTLQSVMTAPAKVTEGRTGADGKWSVSMRMTTRTDGTFYTTEVYGPRTTDGKGIYFQMYYGGGASGLDGTKLEVRANRALTGGDTDRVLFTVPASILEANRTDQLLVWDLIIDGLEVSLAIRNVSTASATITTKGTITAAESAALKLWSEMRVVTFDPRFRADYLVGAAVQVTTTSAPPSSETNDPGVGLQAAIYNGAIAGSRIDDFFERLDRMFPVELDFVWLGHGLNHTDESVAVFQAKLDKIVAALQARQTKKIAFGVATQNPRYWLSSYTWPESRVDDHAARQRSLPAYAKARGFLLADTFAAFEALPDGGRSYVDPLDGTHPIAKGRALQRDVIHDAMSSISVLGTGASQVTPGAGTGGGGSAGSGTSNLILVPGTRGLFIVGK